MFTADRDACFGRVYDAAHLKSPSQAEGHQPPRPALARAAARGRELDARRARGGDPELPRRGPDLRHRLRQLPRPQGHLPQFADLRPGDPRGRPLHDRMRRRQLPPRPLGCELRHAAQQRLRPDRRLRRRDRGRPGACTSIRARTTRCSGSTAKPVAACRAEEQKATPIPAGAAAAGAVQGRRAVLLRARLRRRASREQPEADGVADPRRPARARQGTGRRRRQKCWWFNVKLDVSVTLRSNLKTTTVRYACTPQEASWECHRQRRRRRAVGLQRPQHPARARSRRRNPALQSPFRPADRQRMRDGGDRPAVPDTGR